MTMKTMTGIALALVVGFGGGFAAYSVMNAQNTPASAVDAAAEMASVAQEIAAVEPAAGDEAEKPKTDDPVVAKVDGMDVHKSEVMDFIKTLPQQMQQVPPEAIFPMAVEQVVAAKIVDAKAKSENIASDAEVTKRLDEAKTQIVRSVYAEKAIDKEFTEDAVKKAYDKMVADMPKVDEVRARHILVDSEAKAKDVIKKLEGGAKFEDMAKEHSTDKSNSASGGDLGYFGKTDMVKEFSDAAFALSPNSFSKTPVKTQFGYHIVQVLDKRVRPAPAYDDVKMQLEGQVRRDILNSLVEKWRGGAAVELFDMDGKPLPKPEEKKADAPATAPEEKPAEKKAE